MGKNQKKINENLKLFDPSYHFREGIIKVNMHNSLKHEIAKFLVAWELMKNGSPIYTEVIFKTGDRADVFDALEGYAFEIVESESTASIQRKRREYPCKVGFLRADMILNSNGVVLK